MQYTSHLGGGRVCEVEADELTTRSVGDLWLLRSDRPKPHPLTPVPVLPGRNAHRLCTHRDRPVHCTVALWQLSRTGRARSGSASARAVTYVPLSTSSKTVMA
jgi:hypothetical protein